ncbi:hypothetical protein C8T65DRAFT_830524 [Cerioporus squamosus]|nr:hypothetical protein C8T65DRAFT_830524 [Cerioporus squamosus]
MLTRPFGLVLLICLGSIQACAANFTFTYGAATECDDFDFSWTGGTPPFTLTFVPSYQTKITVVIPDSAFSNSHGSYTTPMRLSAGNETVVVMSDSTGFGSGGVSPLFKVGNSVRHLPCGIKDDPHNDFYFNIDNPFTQCSDVTFSWDKDVIQPVQITGVVAGGSTFVLNPENGSHIFDWKVNIVGGTQVLFFMTDSGARQGGTESVMTVLQSGDMSCLGSGSPASVTNPPASTSTQTGTASASSSASHISTGTLVAAIVAPVVAVTMLAIGTIIWYCRRRRNRGVTVLGGRSKQPEVDLTKGDADAPGHMREVVSPTSTVAFLHGRSPSADGTTTLGSYDPRLPTSATTSQFTEFQHAPASVYSDSTQGHIYAYGPMSPYGSSFGGSSQHGGTPGPAVAYGSGTGMRPDGDSGPPRKAAEAGVLTPPGHQAPAQFILHTDIGDSIPPPVSEVVELPPQYSERRAGTPVAFDSESQPHADHPSLPQAQ